MTSLIADCTDADLPLEDRVVINPKQQTKLAEEMIAVLRPLLAQAKRQELKFLAYLLEMALAEAINIATGVSLQAPNS